MYYDLSKHHRRSIRLSSYDYSWPGWYFVTICSHNRDCIFGEVVEDTMCLNTFGKIAEEEWLRTLIIRSWVKLDDYVVMPGRPYKLTSSSLGSIIGQFKSVSAKRINKLCSTSGVSVWQRSYYDHIMRNDDLHHIREYIANNLLRWAWDVENPQNISVES